MSREYRITFNAEREIIAVEVKTGDEWIQAEARHKIDMPMTPPEHELTVLIGERIKPEGHWCQCPRISGYCWMCLGGVCYYFPC